MRVTIRSPIPRRLVVALLVPLALASPAGAQDEKLLVLRGRVLQPDGTAVAGVRVAVTGLRSARVSTDEGGAYQVELPLGSERRLTQDGFQLHVKAEKPGYRIERPDGSTALDVVYACTGPGSCALSSNDSRVAEALSRCLGPGGPGGAVALVGFVATQETRIYGYVRTSAARAVAGCTVTARLADGATIPATTAADGSFAIPVRTPALARSAEVTVNHAAFVTSPARRRVRLERRDWTGPMLFTASPRAAVPPEEIAAALGAVSHSTAPPVAALSAATARIVSTLAAPATERAPGGPDPASSAPSSGSLARTTLLSAPLVAPAPAEVPPPPACNCSVEGILELRSPTPVEPAPRIVVSLSPDVGVRDTVDFFLGVPRPFRLGGIPCGRYAIRVLNLGAARWGIVNPHGLGEVHCEVQNATEMRVLLERSP